MCWKTNVINLDQYLLFADIEMDAQCFQAAFFRQERAKASKGSISPTSAAFTA